ncbi:MAG: hypothetical protein JRF33_18145 [Deltaproteobacteria bacterium]|nr:hypothetical protein [Deltaproteobacteria bacterium]
MKCVRFGGLWALCLLIFLPACQTSLVGRPAWSVSQVHKDYPASKFFSGAASAENLEEARKMARSRLADNLKKRVREAFEKQMAQVDKGSLAYLSEQAIDELIAEPAGIRIAVDWSSSKGVRHAALAVASRDEVLASAREQSKAYREQVQQLLETAKQMEDKVPYAALLNLLGAVYIEAQATHQRIFVQALAEKEALEDNQETGGSEKALRQWLASLKLSVIRGQGQKAHPGQALSAPLVVAVEWLDQKVPRPLARAPLRLLMQVAKSKPIKLRCEQNGWATSSPMVPATAQGKLQVRVSLDAAQILEDAGLDPTDTRTASLKNIIEGDALSIDLRVPGKDTPRCIVLIAESQNGDFVTDPVSVRELNRLLGDLGCDAVGTDQVKLDLPDAPSEAQIVAALRGQVRWAVLGEAACGVSRELSESFLFSEAWGRFSLYSGIDGKEVKRFEAKLTSPGQDAKTAGKRALKKLSKQAQKAFQPFFKGQSTRP